MSIIIKQGTEDGTLEKRDGSWPPTTIYVDTTGTLLTLAEISYHDWYYHILRSYLRFDTSSIPSNMYIIRAKLWFKLYTMINSSGYDFGAEIYRAYYDWNPLDSSDWGCGNVLVGSKFCRELVSITGWFSIDIDPSCINKGGITAFETRENCLFTPSASTLARIVVYSADSSGNEPYLEIELPSLPGGGADYPILAGG
jgi:hypothetical protein